MADARDLGGGLPSDERIGALQAPRTRWGRPDKGEILASAAKVLSDGDTSSVMVRERRSGATRRRCLRGDEAQSQVSGWVVDVRINEYDALPSP